MQKFYESTGFVAAFMVAVVVMSTFAGSKITNMFLTLVLFSMVILNANKFITFLEGSARNE